MMYSDHGPERIRRGPRDWHFSGDSEIVKDKESLADFAAEFPRCWACGCGFGFLPIQTHHIAKQGRSDDRPNLSRFCDRCHRVIEGERVPNPDGGYMPKLELAHVLWLKRSHDPEFYDRARIQQLRCRATLPRIQQPPAFYLREFIRRTGSAWMGMKL